MHDKIFCNYPFYKEALKHQERYDEALRKYGESKCHKAKILSKQTPFSFFDCVSLTDSELDSAIAKYCKFD
jgi:hypothetical protein